jgi:hypothetical protein
MRHRGEWEGLAAEVAALQGLAAEEEEAVEDRAAAAEEAADQGSVYRRSQGERESNRVESARLRHRRKRIDKRPHSLFRSPDFDHDLGAGGISLNDLPAELQHEETQAINERLDFMRSHGLPHRFKRPHADIESDGLMERAGNSGFSEEPRRKREEFAEFVFEERDIGVQLPEILRCGRVFDFVDRDFAGAHTECIYAIERGEFPLLAVIGRSRIRSG